MDRKILEAESWYDKKRALYERFTKEVEGIIKKVLEVDKIPYQSIAHRVKEKDSYLKKCENEKYTNPIIQIMDLSGIRIIAYTNQDVSNICQVLEREFIVDKENSINKADNLETDKVGYLSIHYIIQLDKNRTSLAEYRAFKDMRCEVQVRTLLQHAWAEIEHDRNYKFAGVLPNNIKRRFHLVAGVLEMMDSEFDKLSRDIDIYAQDMKKAVEEGDYMINIDSTSIEQYMLNRFSEYPNIHPGWKGTIVSEEVVQELLRFGYVTIEDLEKSISKYEKIICLKRDRTYIGVLRDLMILEDCDMYFTKAFRRSWQGADRKSVEFWTKHGSKKISHYLDKYDIDIQD